MEKQRAMKRRLGILLALVSIFECQKLSAGWQPFPRIGVEMDPSVFAYFVAPRFESDFAWQAFDENKKSVGLDQLVFGKTFQLQDVFLASKLAGQGYTNTPSGNYLSLLSTTTVVPTLQQNYTMFSLEGSLNIALGDSDVLLTSGITIPIEAFDQYASIRNVGTALGTTFDGTNTDASYFFSQYPDIQTFVQKEVLAPKGLEFLGYDRSQGLGSIRLFSMLDFSNYWPESVKRLQVGFVAHLNSPQTQNANVVWPIERGFGATYLGGFGQLFLEFNEFINPYFIFEVTDALANNLMMRVPMLKSPSSAQVIAGTATFSNSNILSGSNLAGTHITSTFSEFDSSVPFFADQTLLVRRKRGAFQEVKFGNKFNLGGRALLDIWYEHAHRMADKIERSSKADPSTINNVYDFTVVTQNTKNSYHILGWQLIFGRFETVKLSVGSQYTVFGKTAPQYYQVFTQFEFGF